MSQLSSIVSTWLFSNCILITNQHEKKKQLPKPIKRTLLFNLISDNIYVAWEEI